MQVDPQAPLLITGMHRSGTSLVARFLHHAGIDLGRDLLGPANSNRYGHYEDVEILEFHKQILLREFGHNMWVPAAPLTNEDDRATAKRLITERGEKERWGWKEPRTTLFLDFWDALLPNARYLFLARHPASVMDSLARRTNSRWYHVPRHNRFLQNWLLYTTLCYDFYVKNQGRCLLVTLEAILSAPEVFVDALAEKLDISTEANRFRDTYDEAALTREPSRTWLCWPHLYLRCLSFFRRVQEAADV